MTGTSAKLAYSFVLLVLAIFVAMPVRPSRVTTTAEVVAMPMSTETRLAKAIHQRIAFEAAGDLSASERNQLAAEEDGLRQLAFTDNMGAARNHLIDSLADELSAAMLQRTELTMHPGMDMSEARRIDSVIRALTAAINDEVRGITA